MPGKVKVQILAGRNLPVMDKTNETSDAFVEVKLGGTTYKTDVCRKSLNPIWNSEWFKFEMDDEELQDEPLQMRVMDHDTYSANDAIGKVYVDLNPLLLSPHTGNSMAGWIPIYDTMHGIRGEINILVKVDYFSDFNRFRQSSCGVQCFCCPGIPHGYKLHIIHGFVEELVANEDPEYHWMDKLRTPRASNEARQTLFARLLGEVQRKIGLKALELGGNAVIGYQQCIDLEGESGVTVRGIGTAVTLVRIGNDMQLSPCLPKDLNLESFCPENTCCHSSTTELFSPYLCLFPRPAPTKPPLLLLKSVCGRAPPCAQPPLGADSKCSRGSRLRFPSLAHSVPSSRVPRSLPPPVVPPRALQRFHRRSQSSSAALQDDKSAALQQFVKAHQKCGGEMQNSGDKSPNDVVFDSYNELCKSEHSNLVPSSPTCPGFKDQDRSQRSSNPFFLSCNPAVNIVHASECAGFAMPGDLFPSTCIAQPCFLSDAPLCRRSPLPEDSPGSPITLTPNKLSQSPIKSNVPCVCRRSSDSELNITTKGMSGGSNGTTKVTPRPTLQTDNIEMLEYPFLSMTQFPLSFIIQLGGVIAAQSVKLLGRVNNPDELESRDAWWKEIRMEMRSHARVLGCNVVLGYSESTSICDDVCVLAASGTAAVVCMYHSEGENFRRDATMPLNSEKKEGKVERNLIPDGVALSAATRTKSLPDGETREEMCHNTCTMCHIPYSEASLPFAVSLSRCTICKKSKVPDVLFTTIAPPLSMPITGKGCLIQARVCKAKKEGKGELNAKEISDSLPFLQYELHKQLLNKLKMKGMNGLFDLRIQLSISAKMLIAIATATAVFLTALPPQQLPQISSGKVSDEFKLQELKVHVMETVKKNCEFYNLTHTIFDSEQSVGKDDINELSEDEDDLPELDLNAGNKDACVLEMDDTEDADLIAFLIDPNPPDGFEVVGGEYVPGCDTAIRNLQMFTRICRTKLSSTGNLTCRQLAQYCENVIQSLFFKLRKMIPCLLCNLQFRIELPEDDEIQVTLLGMALGLGDPNLMNKNFLGCTLKLTGPNDPELDASSKFQADEQDQHKLMGLSIERKYKYHTPAKERYGIDITPLSYIPGVLVERYLGKLNFFFIRESTSIKEFGGMSGFVQSFIADVMAIIRAHVAALGGNALLSYFLNEYVLLQNPHKNQGQCLINVGGDVVQVSNPSLLQQPLLVVPNCGDSHGLMPLKSCPKELKGSSSPIGSQG